MPYAILIVDDDSDVRTSLIRGLRGEGYELLQADGAPAALAILQTRAVDLIISDQHMPGMTGLELLQHVRIRWPDTLRIILTGNPEMETVIQALNENTIYRYLVKPWQKVDLKVVIRLALHHLDAMRENAQLAERVRRLTRLVHRLEVEHPGITKIVRDERGDFVVTEDEVESRPAAPATGAGGDGLAA
jgi:DNA-binding NtrC family response regulator